MRSFCFTIDDNIRFLKEISAARPKSIFDHPYTAMLLRLHRKFGVKVQLNLFYRMEGFTLADACADYTEEWRSASDWLRLSFHSEMENERPYEFSGYDEVRADLDAVNREILRFASPESLARTTTVHYCRATAEGLRALSDGGVVGLLGLFGEENAPRTSYGLSEDEAYRARRGEVVRSGELSFASIDTIVNNLRLEALDGAIERLLGRGSVRVMIHEQYFYEDYPRYQPDFEEKLDRIFAALCAHGYESRFFEELISE